MSSFPPNLDLIRSPWGATFNRLVCQAEENLLLASPFIKLSKASQLLSGLQKRGVQNYVRVIVLTDLRPESALNGSTDIEALTRLATSLPRFDLTHLPSLHAKVYIADRKMVAITSGNLTDSGIDGNIEYGIVTTDSMIVGAVRDDFERYGQLSAKVSLQQLCSLQDEMKELKSLFKKAQKTIRDRARKVFEDKLDAARVQLMRYRARGKTTHAILSETILYLLGKGPLRTVELHPLIQFLHPDICDDSIDRVIDGVHFGKKWKHFVRNAQQFLKRDGRIRFDGKRWHLVS